MIQPDATARRITKSTPPAQVTTQVLRLAAAPPTQKQFDRTASEGIPVPTTRPGEPVLTSGAEAGRAYSTCMTPDQGTWLPLRGTPCFFLHIVIVRDPLSAEASPYFWGDAGVGIYYLSLFFT